MAETRPAKRARTDAAPSIASPTLQEEKKSEEEFRNYEDSDRQDVVRHHYSLMRARQSKWK